MARYMQTAADANAVAKNLLAMVPDADKPAAAALIAKLVNLGIRCSPRGVQHTVRLTAVQIAVRGLPAKVRMKSVPKSNGMGTFNALEVEPDGGQPTVEGDNSSDGE